ncbi:MAG: response regulator [Candidatus Omnitrophica bacterium]|nr:response regulator [Candidatus Omnitrophota bacterium]
MKRKALTTFDIAKYCQVTHRAVLQWIQAGKLKAYRTPGNHSRINKEDFVQFLNKYKMPIPDDFQDPTSTFHKTKILLVDDDLTMIKALKRALLLENRFVIDEALDGFSAGVKFLEFKPDVVVLDLRMPGMDGFEVCRNIRRDPKNSRIIILAISAFMNNEEAQKIIDLGANDYMYKPINNQEFIQKIDKLIFSTLKD